MPTKTRDDIRQETLEKRKGAFKRIMGLFGRQPKAEEVIRGESAITPYAVDGLYGKGDSTLTKQYTDYVYGTYLVKLSTKSRIQEYYRMASDPEINYALTEIVDEIVQESEDNKLYTLRFDDKVPEPVRKILIEEFTTLIINRLRLGDCNLVWEWAYKWIVQGVLSFNINFSNELATGIESLVEIQPWLVSKLKTEKTKEASIDKYFVIMNHEGAEEGFKHDPIEILQIDCGYNYDGEYFSMLEFAKKDWRRLNLMEDGTVIYKLSRSPLRRIFKVFVGKMAPKEVEHYLLDFRQKLREDITYDSDKGEIIGLNPITLLDDYFFPVIEGGQAICDVDTISEKDTKWESMDEIRYFLGKVYRALKIPVGRMNLPNEQGEYSTAATGSKSGEIMRDEVKFSKFIKRLQNRFIEGFIQELFYRHLFFRGLIEKLNLGKNDIQIKFSYVNPYSELKNAEVEDYRMNSFGLLSPSTDLLSFQFLAKRYLKWTDEELMENFKLLKKENKMRLGMGLGEPAGGGMGGGGGFSEGGTGEVPGTGVEGEQEGTLEETPSSEATDQTGTEVGAPPPAAPVMPT